MEKISAAYAMEWSIELEKGLRSKNPDRQIEAILQFGPKLQLWSRELSVTVRISDMFGLVPGEDRLFANTVLLRLADAFRTGDDHMRASILKVFLQERKHRKKKGKHYKGILAKERVPNYLELLRRVKIVYNTGRAKSRVFSLCLFGCWADLAKDSAEIRYMILSSLESSDVSEVKASLFAAGCFCESSEEFSCFILKILIGMVTSSEKSSDLKLIAARAFPKIGCSSLVAKRVYQAGKKLALDSSQEEFVIEMLSSLTRLALKSMLLLPEQVELLLSFINQESTSSVRSKALRCLCFLSVRGSYHLPVYDKVFATLFHVLDSADFSIVSQCEALQTLRKIFCCSLTSLPCMDMLEFTRNLSLVEKAAQSQITTKRFLALGVLVDLSCKLARTRVGHLYQFPEQCSVANVLSHESSGYANLAPDGNGPAPFPRHVTSLILDQITLLVKQANAGPKNGEPKYSVTEKHGFTSEVKQESLYLFKFILRLVKIYPTLGQVVLDRIRCLVEQMVKADIHCGVVSEMDMDGEVPSSSACRFSGFEEKEHASNADDLVLFFCRFVGACLTTLDEAGTVSVEVYQTVKLFLEHIQLSGFSTCNMSIFFSLLLHSCLMWHCSGNGNNTSSSINIAPDKLNISNYSSISQDECWVDHEWLTLEFAKKLVRESEFWVAYRTAKYAACEGAWFSATFTFRLLVKQVESDACHYWLKSLVLLAGAESEIQLLLFPEQGIQLVNRLQVNGDKGTPQGNLVGLVDQDVTGNADLQDCEGKFARAHSRVCSAVDMLAASATSCRAYSFQRWFLRLRGKLLETVADVFGLLSSIASTGGNTDGGFARVTGNSQTAKDLHCFANQITCISLRLKKLATEFDLLGTSFMDIDFESFRSISRLALNCSILAFCTGFVTYFPDIPACNNVISQNSENSERSLRSMLIQDLAERLWHIDRKTSTDLQLFMSVTGDISSSMQATTQLSHSGHRERATIVVCRFVVSSVLRMQEESRGAKDEESHCMVFRAQLQLLSDVVMKWIYIPFQAPKYLFTVRPCIGAELFMFNADPQNKGGISVSLGFCLSLNLCIQMKNTKPNSPILVDKMYCVVAASSSTYQPELGECVSHSNFQDLNTDEMMNLSDELLRHMRDDVKKASRTEDGAGASNLLAKAFVCFEANERGQGFSTCLLDVSAFPEGYYQIIWHSCCIDSKGSYWNLLPLNAGPVFSVKKA